MLNLAVCHEQIGKVASAWGEFKQALAEAKKAGREDRILLATQHIEKLEPELSYMTIHVPPSARVTGFEVVRNGSVLNQGAWDAELPVDPGKVEIVTRAPGYKPRTKTVTVDKLEKAPEPVVIVSDPGWTGQRKLGFALMGVGIVGLGVGGYFGYRTLQSKSDSDKACPVLDAERRCSTLGAEKMDTARRDAWISNIGLGVGLGSLAVGAYLFIKGGRPADAPKTVAGSLQWSVGPTRDGVAGVLVGAF